MTTTQLSLATMFVHSNDVFASPAGAAGPDQAPRQAGPNTGADEGNSTVRLLNDPVWRYPMLSDVLRVTITPHIYHLFLPLVLKGSG